MNKKMLEKYAQLIVKMGVNVAPGDEVVIAADASAYEFAEAVSLAAYQSGAKKVTPLLGSERMMAHRFKFESDEVLSDIPDWVVKSREYAAEKNACYISIINNDPDAYAGLDAQKIAAYMRSYRGKLKKFFDATMSNQIRWTIAGYPGAQWAEKVFPGDPDAVEKLGNLIAKTMRLDTADPEKAWEEHQQTLSRRVEYMNKANFKSLHYKNSIGTDFYVELPKDYVFLGGQEVSSGRVFMANLPTEEVFSAPSKLSARGKLVSSMPLVRNGSRIDKFFFTFENGKVTDYGAEQGYDVLKGIIQTDEGASYLGEVAIVPFDSPIQKLGTVFYNTLFDENASCHFALGKAYPCLKDAENLTPGELAEAGLNDSLEHVDFMIGTADLEITGVTQDGKEIKFFQNGNFAIPELK